MANKILTQTLQFSEDFFHTIGGILLAFIRQLAPFAVPFAPAYFLGHAVGAAASLMGAGSGLWVGAIAALGLESAGILSAHYAVKYYTTNDKRWYLATAAVLAYLTIGIVTIWLLDGDHNGRIVGTAMFLIAGIVYGIVGMAESDRMQEVEKDKRRDFQIKSINGDKVRQHELAILDRQLRHDERIAQISAKTTPHKSQDAPQSVGDAQYYECVCGKVYEKPQSYSAHTRHCAVIRAGKNGVVK